MHEYKEILGIIPIGIAVISYSDYFFNIFKRGTIPRTISWFIWGVLSAIAFSVQSGAHGGSGVWITGFTAVMCFTIALVSFFKCDEHFTLYDWLPLAGAFITLFLWLRTDNPILAIVLTCTTYAIGFIPTLHNAYLHPKQETVVTFALNGLKFFIAFFALESYTLETWLFPITLTVLNVILVAVILMRRKR